MRKSIGSSNGRATKSRPTGKLTGTGPTSFVPSPSRTLSHTSVVNPAGTVITGSTPLYDLPNGRIIRPDEGAPLVVPEGAVVVPGARQVTVGEGAAWGLSLATPVIVKYRDAKTDTRTELERWIR